MMVARSLLLFVVVAALAEIGGAWLVWRSRLDRRRSRRPGRLRVYRHAAGGPHFGRVLAAYGGIFVAGSLAWGMAVDGFRPDRYDVAGALVCLAGWQ